MNTIVRRACNLCRSPPLLPIQGVNSVSGGEHQIQQCRGIRVRVHNGNLEQALKFMQRKMQSSGIERQIKNLQTHHVKNSEKRVLARKKLQRRIQSQELAHRIKVILADKARCVLTVCFWFLEKLNWILFILGCLGFFNCDCWKEILELC
jgi:small subunit ribosomal protein S21